MYVSFHTTHYWNILVKSIKILAFAILVWQQWHCCITMMIFFCYSPPAPPFLSALLKPPVQITFIFAIQCQDIFQTCAAINFMFTIGLFTEKDKITSLCSAWNYLPLFAQIIWLNLRVVKALFPLSCLFLFQTPRWNVYSLEIIAVCGCVHYQLFWQFCQQKGMWVGASCPQNLLHLGDYPSHESLVPLFSQKKKS